MGNAESGPITLVDWMHHVTATGILTEIVEYAPTRTCHPEDIETKKKYHIYHVRKPGSVAFSIKLLTSKYSFGLGAICRHDIAGDYVFGLLGAGADLILCMRTKASEWHDEKGMMAALLGFAVVSMPEGTDVLYVDAICSNCQQGTKIMQTLEDIMPISQRQLFGKTYDAIALKAMGRAIHFYKKLGYTELDPDADDYFVDMIKRFKGAPGNPPQRGSGKCPKGGRGRGR